MRVWLPGFAALSMASAVALAQGRLAGVLMPDGATSGTLAQCSRSSPVVEGSWHASRKDLDGLEAHLPELSRMADMGRSVAHPEQSYRQYFGVVVEGRRVIYVNAFPAEDRRLVKNWKTRAVVVCDGGASFWGALYDPKAMRFIKLDTNGVV